MRCDQVRQQLAIYRELTLDERQVVDHHVASCPDCAAVMHAYWEQDEALSRALGADAIVPSRPWMDDVMDRTVRAPRGRRGAALGLARTVAVAVLAFLVLAVGTVGVSAQALPGSGLYPVKRAVEQVRLNLTRDDAKRAEYLQTLVELRRREVELVLEQQRAAAAAEPGMADPSDSAATPDDSAIGVAFEGPLVQGDAGGWVIGGIAVDVEPAAAQSAETWVGHPVAVEAVVAGGRVTVARLEALPTPTAAAGTAPMQPKERDEQPTVRPSVSPTTSSTALPPSATLTLRPMASPTARPSLVMSATPRPTLAEEGVATARAIKMQTASAAATATARHDASEIRPTLTPQEVKPTAVRQNTSAAAAPDRLATAHAQGTRDARAASDARATTEARATADVWATADARPTSNAWPTAHAAATSQAQATARAVVTPQPTDARPVSPTDEPTPAPAPPTREPTPPPTRWSPTLIPSQVPTRWQPTMAPTEKATAVPPATKAPATPQTERTPVPPPTRSDPTPGTPQRTPIRTPQPLKTPNP